MDYFQKEKNKNIFKACGVPLGKITLNTIKKDDNLTKINMIVKK